MQYSNHNFVGNTESIDMAIYTGMSFLLYDTGLVFGSWPLQKGLDTPDVN